MTDIKDQLIHLIEEKDISSIYLMSTKLSVDEENIKELLNELVQEGQLNGFMTEDEQRFFKTEVDVSQKPIIPRNNKEPDFLSYDTKPGTIIFIIGFVIVMVGLLGVNIFQDIEMQNVITVMLFIGLAVTTSGCFLLSKYKTPV